MTMHDTQVAGRSSTSETPDVSHAGYPDFVAGYLSYNGLKQLAGHFVTRRIRQDFVKYVRSGDVPAYMQGRLA